MGAGQCTEDEDECEQASTGDQCVLQQFEADVARRQLLGSDPGSDDDGGQQGTAKELGDQAAPQGHGLWCTWFGCFERAQQHDEDGAGDDSAVAPTVARSGVQQRSSPPSPSGPGASPRTV